MHWEVELVGDSHDLAALAEVLTQPDLLVQASGKQYILASRAFEHLDAAGDVRELARHMVTSISGVARLRLRPQASIRVGSVYRVDDAGGRGVFLFPESATLVIQGFAPTVTIGRADRTLDVRRPADPVATWVPLASQEPLVAKALRLRDKDHLNWADLYRLYEVILSDSGSRITQLGWVTKSLLEAFTRTANSVTAAGDDARHGKETTQPPANPMSLPEARGLLDQLLTSWLAWKASCSQGSP